ncbi:LutC/YkgG family protein [Enterovibrio baiacu]|uniref:LutC/YkgG family protein n=1 Tax=Enterovibrio baiacu TaxID=2491023 RepID=UPI001010837E|nr:LUD domain-containing protein [Enterovibrio baiacu]MBE1274455.1 lactate utilization protein C [Enterovibrio baiacu]
MNSSSQKSALSVASSTARARIFSRLNAGKAASMDNPAVDASQHAEHATNWQPWHSDNRDVLSARLRDTLSASHAEVHHIEADNIESALAHCLHAASISRLLVGKANPYADALEAASPAMGVTKYDQDIEAVKHDLFHDIDAGFSVCPAAIADTGTLALFTGEEEPRALSLVPPIHIAIIHERDIVANFGALMETAAWTRANWSEDPLTNLLLISGPSKTADIQQTLAYGAHGPKRLIVFVVKEQP